MGLASSPSWDSFCCKKSSAFIMLTPSPDSRMLTHNRSSVPPRTEKLAQSLGTFAWLGFDPGLLILLDRILVEQIPVIGIDLIEKSFDIGGGIAGAIGFNLEFNGDLIGFGAIEEAAIRTLLTGSVNSFELHGAFGKLALGTIHCVPAFL